jgi:hypothetical protein
MALPWCYSLLLVSLECVHCWAGLLERDPTVKPTRNTCNDGCTMWCVHWCIYEAGGYCFVIFLFDYCVLVLSLSVLLSLVLPLILYWVHKGVCAICNVSQQPLSVNTTMIALCCGSSYSCYQSTHMRIAMCNEWEFIFSIILLCIVSLNTMMSICRQLLIKQVLTELYSHEVVA